MSPGFELSHSVAPFSDAFLSYHPLFLLQHALTLLPTVVHVWYDTRRGYVSPKAAGKKRRGRGNEWVKERRRATWLHRAAVQEKQQNSATLFQTAAKTTSTWKPEWDSRRNSAGWALNPDLIIPLCSKTPLHQNVQTLCSVDTWRKYEKLV